MCIQRGRWVRKGPSRRAVGAMPAVVTQLSGSSAIRACLVVPIRMKCRTPICTSETYPTGLTDSRDHGCAEHQERQGVCIDQRLRWPQAGHGRKIPLLIYTLGLPISISTTPADNHDKIGALRLLVRLKPLALRLTKVWADGARMSGKVARWCGQYRGWDLEIVGYDRETQIFAVQPRWWVGSGHSRGWTQSPPAHRL